jgi:hypothetical protein
MAPSRMLAAAVLAAVLCAAPLARADDGWIDGR